MLLPAANFECPSAPLAHPEYTSIPQEVDLHGSGASCHTWNPVPALRVLRMHKLNLLLMPYLRLCLGLLFLVSTTGLLQPGPYPGLFPPFYKSIY